MDTAAPHSHALRRGRRSIIGQIHLVTFRTDGCQQFFNEWFAGVCVVREMKRAKEERTADTLSYVVMPDHVHWLLQLKQGTLSRLVRAVKSRAAIAYNEWAGRSGPVWQVGFHDHALRSDEQVVAAARYVVANPLRKALVTEIGQYPLWDAIWLDENHRGQARSHSLLAP
ncbi:MAG: REP-associated tyrosine transposase [Pseudomonadota bacterium]